jgi:hypothetical protein
MRKYQRKPGRVNPDRRMARAAELRAEGLSHYQIAERLLCDEKTVRNDLKRWAVQNANVTPLVRNSGAEKVPHGGEFSAPDSAPADPNIISLSDRRKQA